MIKISTVEVGDRTVPVYSTDGDVTDDDLLAVAMDIVPRMVAFDNWCYIVDGRDQTFKYTQEGFRTYFERLRDAGAKRIVAGRVIDNVFQGDIPQIAKITGDMLGIQIVLFNAGSIEEAVEALSSLLED